jgi:LacI family transcriptional regulator
MNRTRKTPTIRDVAEAAGVSVSTVSRVLNNKDDVARETCQKVQAVIEELGYTSSLAAKSMRSHRTDVIGLVTPDVGDDFSILVMKGVNRAIDEVGYDLIIYTGGDVAQESLAEREQRYVSLLNGSITDGVIVVTPAAATFATASPVVIIDPNIHGPDYPAVIATNHAGALAVMRYLIDLGHRRIGFIKGRSDLISATQRQQGYEDGLREAGVAMDADLIQQGDYTEASGFQSAQKLLAQLTPPTAIFAANDQSAIGAIRAIRQAGLRVPDDISVVGFDNTPGTAHISPSLTTVDQSIDDMGYVATEILINLIQGKPGGFSLESKQYQIPTQLIVRDSCHAIRV